MRIPGFACLLPLAIASACTTHKSTSEELVAALQGQHIEVRVMPAPSSGPEWPGYERSEHFILDGYEDYMADRFASTDITRGYCESFKSGVRVDIWCLHPTSGSFSPETWAKVSALRTR